MPAKPKAGPLTRPAGHLYTVPELDRLEASLRLRGEPGIFRFEQLSFAFNPHPKATLHGLCWTDSAGRHWVAYAQ